MNFRPFICVILAVALGGCATDEEKALEKAKKDAANKEQPLKRQAEDTAFLAFLGRLRIAVQKRDIPTLSSMMTADFGYRWDTPPVGDNIFTYWDLNNIWPELNRVLRDKFVAHDNYMVAPASVVTESSYQGYRAGMRIVNGSWKFAYFVPGEGTVQQ